MPEEVAFFGRTSLYGLVLAAVYWFVSYDVAGTALLGGFGLATGAGFVLLWRRHHVARREAGAPVAGSLAASLDPDRPFTDESGPVPLGSFAPLEVGFGIAVAALGLVFGIWFALVASIPLAAGAVTWVREARREHDLVAGREPRAQARTERSSGDLAAR